MIKTGWIVVSFAAIAFAADPPQQAAPPQAAKVSQGQGTVKKLGAVTWNPESHKLIWVVQLGAMANGRFVASSEQKYEVSPDEATMAMADEKRGFDDQSEAVSLQHLLDMLSLYCAESVVWWDEGQGTPVGPNDAPERPMRPITPGPVRPGAPKPSEAKPVRVRVEPPVKAVALAERR